jgi:hypothetical protein
MRRPFAFTTIALLGASIVLAVTGAAAKFHMLAAGSYPPNSRVPITTTELNTYVNAEVHNLIGPGIRNVRIETDAGNIARGHADIDFMKVRQAVDAEKPNWLLQQLLAGERPVDITIRVTSGHGMARVDVLRVVISGVVAEGRTLDILISTFLLPTFPDAKIGKEFALDYNIDRLEIVPRKVIVVLKNQPFRAAQSR